MDANTPVTPAIHVTIGGTELKYGLDYTVSYENNKKPGTATAVVTGIIKYSGTVQKDFTILEKNSQEISVAGGRITHVDNYPYDGGSTAKLAPGHFLTVKADAAPEGKTFSHWRVIPSNTEIAGTGKPVTTFMVPENPCRLIAIYKNEDGTTGSANVMSKSIPSNWFAYGDEEDLELMLADVLTEEDRQVVLQGNQVDVIMTIKRSERMPDLPSTANTFKEASPLNAGYITASSSNADPSLLDLHLGKNSDASDVVGFYIDTALSKAVKKPSGTSTTSVTSPVQVKISFQLPDEDRDMKNYEIIHYGQNNDSNIMSEITPEVNGNIISFHADTNGIYALRYTLCHTVTFVDYDGHIISKQRIPHGEGAIAPAPPYREGYTFTGWSKEFESVTKDITVKAQYEKIYDINKDRLNEKIREIKRKIAQINKSDYTQTSWERLIRALDDAIEVAGNENATQEEVNQALQKLNTAWNKLETYPVDDSQDNSSGSTKPQEPANSIPVTLGAWVTDSTGWKYQLSDSSYASDQWAYIQYKGVEEWYRFDSDGTMMTQWFKDTDGSLYYLNPEPGSSIGRLFTGWHWITGADGTTRCYYFQEVSNGTRGKLLTKTTTPDGYTVNENGEWLVNGTVQIKP